MVYTSVVREGDNEARGQLGQRGHAVSIAVTATTSVAATLLLLISPSSAQVVGEGLGEGGVKLAQEHRGRGRVLCPKCAGERARRAEAYNAQEKSRSSDS